MLHSPISINPTFFVSNITSSVTGTTNATVLATINIPPNTMGPNSLLRVWVLFTYTNSANNKVIRVNLNGNSSQIITVTNTTTALISRLQNVYCKNSNIAKVYATSNTGTTGLGTSTGTNFNINNNTNIVVDFIGALANAGETISLRAAHVEIFNSSVIM